MDEEPSIRNTGKLSKGERAAAGASWTDQLRDCEWVSRIGADRG